ncbi:MAG: hypothetical protein J6D11_00340 [Clostridia bacterium]|nr:hypothetical protein [Clostridia bacterium]
MLKTKTFEKITELARSEKANKVYRAIPTVLCWFYAILSLAAVLYYTIWPAEGYFHSDCTDTIFWAQASVDGGAVFNPDFCYAALLPFSASVWLVPLIKIFGVTMTTHIIGMVIFGLLFFLSIIFVCRSLEWSWNITLLTTGSVMLLLSSSDKMREIMWGHVIYYSLGLLILFVGLGILVRMCKNFELGKMAKGYVWAALLFVFMMLGATNGLQCIAIYTLPIVAGIAAEIFFNSKEKLISRHNMFHIFGILILCAATFSGLILLNVLKGDIVAGYANAYSLLDDVANWVDNLLLFPESYLSLFGIKIADGASLGSMETISALVKTVVAAAILVLPLVLLLCYRKIKERNTKILLWAHIAVSAVIMVGFICGRLSAGNWRLIPMVGTSILVSFAAIREMFAMENCALVWKRVGVVMLIVPLMGSLVNFKAVTDMPKDYGKDNELHVLAEFLEEQELEYGYATFWYSQSLTLISDSEVRVRCVNADSKNGVTPYYYQTNKTWYEDQDGVEKYFVALTNYESSIVSYNSEWKALLEAHLLETYTCGNFKIFVFDVNIFTAQ